MPSDLDHIRAWAKGMTMEQLKQAEKIIHAEMDQTIIRAGFKFSVGDKVAFSARGNDHKGIVKKVNSKSVSVITERGEWRVSPTLLELV